MTRPMLVLLALAAAACRGQDAPPPEPGDAPAKLPADAIAAAAAPASPGADEPDELSLVPARFSDLPGWADDRHAEALPPFLSSCRRLARRDDDARVGVDGYSGRARDWRRACAAGARVPAGDDAAARAFFEAEFSAHAAHGQGGPEGRMTGYFVQTLNGSRTRHGPYQTPIYGRPPDLVSVDLTGFIPDARARRIWGRLDERRRTVVPYPTRAEIRRGALDGQGLEILWVDDPVDALFTEVEGSGRATLDDGSEIWLEFAGKNGRPYTGVGRRLRELGELEPGEGTMPGIRAWFSANPDRLDEIIDQNESKVFFSLTRRPGATGSQGVILTARRSLAIDRAFVAHSTPIWVETRAPVPGEPGTAPWRQLVIAQDTGGGILGPVRGDIYWGDDAEAAEIGGRMAEPGRYWLLLPRGLAIPPVP